MKGVVKVEEANRRVQQYTREGVEGLEALEKQYGPRPEFTSARFLLQGALQLVESVISGGADTVAAEPAETEGGQVG